MGRHFRTNIHAMFQGLPGRARASEPGSTIVNSTSVQAYSPSAHLIDYASTKAAINNFTKGLATQLAPRGIRVNSVAPGPIWTPLQVSDGQPKDALPHFGKNTRRGRGSRRSWLPPTSSSPRRSRATSSVRPSTSMAASRVPDRSARTRGRRRHIEARSHSRFSPTAQSCPPRRGRRNNVFSPHAMVPEIAPTTTPVRRLEPTANDRKMSDCADGSRSERFPPSCGGLSPTE